MENEFIYPLRVHIEDTDYGGVVYHSNYLNYFERARSEWFDALGYGITWQQQHKVLFPVYTANLHYIKPARLHEKVEVVSKLKDISVASLTFDQHLRLANEPDKMLCQATIKLACTDYQMQICKIPNAPLFENIRRMLT